MYHQGRASTLQLLQRTLVTDGDTSTIWGLLRRYPRANDTKSSTTFGASQSRPHPVAGTTPRPVHASPSATWQSMSRRRLLLLLLSVASCKPRQLPLWVQATTEPVAGCCKMQETAYSRKLAPPCSSKLSHPSHNSSSDSRSRDRDMPPPPHHSTQARCMQAVALLLLLGAWST